MKHYKIQIAQKLQAENDKRQQLASSSIEMSDMNPSFLEEPIMSDEVHVCLGCSVNK